MIIINKNEDIDINYIKRMFCKFKCTSNKTLISTQIEDTFTCPKCDEEFSGSFDVEVFIDEYEACQLCQIDNFLRELQDNNIIFTTKE